MKKIILASTVAVFALLAVAPTAMASEDDSTRANKKGEKIAEIHLELKELVKKYPKIRTGKVELVSKTDSEIVVKVYSPTDKPAKDKIKAKNKARDKSKMLSLDNAEELIAEKTYTIKVDENTRYFRRYWGESSLAEITVGDKLWLLVADYGNDNYYGIAVKDNSIFFRNLRGKITNINYDNQTFVINRGDKKLTIHVTDNTKLIVPGVENPTFKDLREDQHVRVRGVVNGRTKNMDARKIKVLKLRPRMSVGAVELE